MLPKKLGFTKSYCRLTTTICSFGREGAFSLVEVSWGFLLFLKNSSHTTPTNKFNVDFDNRIGHICSYLEVFVKVVSITVEILLILSLWG